MPESGIPELSRSENLLGAKSASDRLLENPFLNAAAHSFMGPAEAIAQVVDKTTGSKLLPSLHVVPDAQKQDFGSFGWFQQQIGGAVGALPYLVALHQGSKAALSSRMLSADTRLMLGAGLKLGAEGAGQVMRWELASAGITGLTYGGLLTPVRPEETATAGTMFAAKLRNGVVGAGTFMTLSGSMMGSKALAEGMSPSWMKTVMASDIGAGVLSGVPAGLVNAQGDSLLRGKGFASLKDSAETALGFAVIGGLMPAAQKGLGAVSERMAPSKATDVIPIEKVTPKDAAQLLEPRNTPSVKAPEKVFTPEQLAEINARAEVQATLKETKFRESEPERVQQWADDAYGTGAAVKDHKLHILLGNCGAGKSRPTEALARELGAMTPDSDVIKARIPGYEKGIGNQAVHEDSSAAYKILLDRALQNGDNIVWQGVGKTAKSVTDLIAQAKSHGYEVVVHMVDAPPEVAAMRVFNRSNEAPHPETGIRQMIPPDLPLLQKYQYVPRTNFFKIIGEAAQNYQAGNGKAIDGFRMWNSAGRDFSSPLPVIGTLPNLRPAWMQSPTSIGLSEDLTKKQGTVNVKGQPAP